VLVIYWLIDAFYKVTGDKRVIEHRREITASGSGSDSNRKE